MKVRIENIPIEGKELAFSLDNDALNARISAASLNGSSKKSQEIPSYVFNGDTKVHLRLSPRGSAVALLGSVEGKYVSPCARCAEAVTQVIETPIDMFLKQKKTEDSDSDEDEDIGFGFHDGEIIDCSEIAEELLLLALPMTVRCEEDTVCGQSSADEAWVFGEESAEEGGDERMKVFRSLKIH